MRCSFFILGSVAEKYPETIRAIQEAGHEIASHGYGHKSVSQMSAGEFRSDLRRASDILESITGTRVLGFRAPSFSVTEEILPWYYETLEDRVQIFVEHLRGQDILIRNPRLSVSHSYPLGPRLAHAGCRDSNHKSEPRLHGSPPLPPSFSGPIILRKVRQENAAGRPAMLYLHPREIDPGQPRLPLTKTQSTIHYYGIAGCERKVQEILSGARFTTIEEYLTTRGLLSDAHAA